MQIPLLRHSHSDQAPATLSEHSRLQIQCKAPGNQWLGGPMAYVKCKMQERERSVAAGVDKVPISEAAYATTVLVYHPPPKATRTDLPR